MSAADRSPSGALWADGERRPAMRVVGPLLGAVWVLFLLQPWQAAWEAAPGAARTISLAAVAGQAAVFLVTALGGSQRRRRRHGGWRWAWPALATQAVCVALAGLAAHQVALVGLIFLAVSAILTRPFRQAIAVVLVALAAVFVVPRVVPGWQTFDDLALSLALASSAMVGFTSLMSANRDLREAQDQVAVLAVDRERERIARDMHDILGHTLTVVAVKAELAGRLVEVDPPRARDEIGQVQALARTALADVRAMVTATRDVTLAGELAGARHALDSAGIEAQVPTVADEVPERLRPLFAWAVREGVTNVLRHSAASNVLITMTADCLVVEDDGRGPTSGAAGRPGDGRARTDQAAPGRPGTGPRGTDSPGPGPQDAGGGNGLPGLAERARAVGASVESGGVPGGGYRLTVRAGAVR
ncbi:MAG: histidine kinase [Cellulomonas sp.]|nr:histidine kinase [Cellulomonas sp.]